MSQWLAWARCLRASHAPGLHAVVPFGPAANGSELQLETVSNARDLGGLAGAGGRRVRHGRLYRSGNPALACGADIERLQGLGLDMVVDFRSPAEKSADEAPFGQRFNWIAMPVLEGSMAMDVLMPRLRESTPEDVDAFMLGVYRDFPVRYRRVFGDFMRNAQAGKTLLYHCTAGKDRTGFASMLLLSALGVGQDDILANYLESNQRNARFNAQALERIAQFGIRPEVMTPLLEVRASYLEASMQAIEAAYGDMERYLCDGLDVDVEGVRGYYLEG
ncbi:tyrosine-protein phosphatase [Cupriavidus laharis]|uniref:tyrosine-protein phosphatase n=1 Tax=Cupriavidus laharis TaxID=151654 RepID=UPI0037BEE246